MKEDVPENEVRLRQAFAMLKAFTSVGVHRFHLVRLDIDGMKRDFRCSRNESAMTLLLPYLVPLCWKRQESLVIRPEKPPCGVLAQLDDLDAAGLQKIAPMAFLLLETSPRNYQGWIVIEDGDNDIVRRLVRGFGVDFNASRAVRVAGSPNCKHKYAPNFPMVRIVGVGYQRMTTTAHLASLGLLATLPDVQPQVSQICDGSTRARGWPNYQQCWAGAPLKQDGKPDRDRVDYLWSKWALERGNSRQDVAAKLLEVSGKAQEEWARGNRNYAMRTVQAASAAKW